MKINRQILRIPIIHIVIITAAIFGSCSMFGTRNPESPDGGSSIWNPPASPSEALENVALGFQIRNSVIYMKSFAQPGYSDSAFAYVPDNTSASYDSAVFIGWGYEKEQSFILTLFSGGFLPADSVCEIEFIAESEPPGVILPIYRESYILTIHHTNPALPIQYSGRAEIQFDRNHNGDWVIIRWTDENSDGSPTLTELKSAISS